MKHYVLGFIFNKAGIMNAIQEMVKTPVGLFAMFIFVFGAVMAGGLILTALLSRDFHNFLSDIFLGGVKCKACKKRSKEWIQWHQKKNEDTYTGWEWCRFCDAKRYEGFQDGCF